MIFAVDLSNSWPDEHHSFLTSSLPQLHVGSVGSIFTHGFRLEITAKKFSYFFWTFWFWNEGNRPHRSLNILINKNVEIIAAGTGFVLKVTENSICQLICLVVLKFVLLFYQFPVPAT